MARFPLAALVLVAGLARAEDSKLKYPDTKTADQTDTYHGTPVPDPYRWLEDDVRKSRRRGRLGGRPEQSDRGSTSTPSPSARPPSRTRITEPSTNYEKIGAPSKVAGRKYIFSKNNGLQNQSVLFLQDTAGVAEPRELLDPNQWAKDGTGGAGRVRPQRRRASSPPTGWPRPAATGTSGTCSTWPPAKPLSRRAEMGQVQ